jgi:hypothetical protein
LLLELFGGLLAGDLFLGDALAAGLRLSVQADDGRIQFLEAVRTG